MKTPTADRKYKREIIKLVNKLPFNIGVRFHDVEMALAQHTDSHSMNVQFTTLRGERQYAQSMHIWNHEPPPRYLVGSLAHHLITAMLDEEENEDA